MPAPEPAHPRLDEFEAGGTEAPILLPQDLLDRMGPGAA